MYSRRVNTTAVCSEQDMRTAFGVVPGRRSMASIIAQDRVVPKAGSHAPTPNPDHVPSDLKGTLESSR